MDKRLSIFVPVYKSGTAFTKINFPSVEGLEGVMVKSIECIIRPKCKIYEPSELNAVASLSTILASNLTLVNDKGQKSFDRLPLGYITTTLAIGATPTQPISFNPMPINQRLNWKESFITGAGSLPVDYGFLFVVRYA